MKNDNLKFTKIEKGELNEQNFFPVPIFLTKAEYNIFKKYDEDLIAKIIGCSIHAVDKTKLENTSGINIKLVIKI